MNDVSVLIAAAGSGERLGLGPKARLALNGRTLEEWLVRKAQGMGGEVIVARAAGAGALPAGTGACTCIVGGATRQDSVHRLVRAATREWVSVWYVSRPFASLALAQAVLVNARQGSGAAGTFLPLDMPVAITENGRVAQIIGARNAALVQTPCAFRRTLLLDVLDRAQAGNWQAGSLQELVLRAGYEIGVVPGEKRNIKLTSPEDWTLAQALAGWLE